MRESTKNKNMSHAEATDGNYGDHTLLKYLPNESKPSTTAKQSEY